MGTGGKGGLLQAQGAAEKKPAVARVTWNCNSFVAAHLAVIRGVINPSLQSGPPGNRLS